MKITSLLWDFILLVNHVRFVNRLGIMAVLLLTGMASSLSYAADIEQTQASNFTDAKWHQNIWGTPAAAPTAGNDYFSSQTLYSSYDNMTFPGDSLTINSGCTLRLLNEKTYTVNLICNGGWINTYADNLFATLAGTMTITAQTLLWPSSNSGSRRFTVASQIYGNTGKIVVVRNTSASYDPWVKLTSDNSSTYSGPWELAGGTLIVEGGNMGTGNITMTAFGTNYGKLMATTDVEQTNSVLTITVGDVEVTDSNILSVKELWVAGTKVPRGLYTMANLDTTYSTASTSFLGDGFMQVGPRSLGTLIVVE